MDPASAAQNIPQLLYSPRSWIAARVETELDVRTNWNNLFLLTELQSSGPASESLCSIGPVPATTGTGHQSVMDHRSQIMDHRSWITDHRSQIIYHRTVLNSTMLYFTMICDLWSVLSCLELTCPVCCSVQSAVLSCLQFCPVCWSGQNCTVRSVTCKLWSVITDHRS